MLDDERKFLIHRNDDGELSQWGRPVLRSAYVFWKFKQLGVEFWAKAAQIVGVPSILALFETKSENEAKTRAKNLTDILSEWQSGSSGAFGNVKDIKVVSSQINDFDTLIKTCNTEIAYALTGQSLATNEGQYGTRAQGDVHSEVYDETIKGDAYLLQKTDQKLVNAFVELNFPGEVAPQYDIDSTDFANWEIVRDAIDRGIPVSLKALYNKVHLPQPVDEKDSFVKAQPSFGFADTGSAGKERGKRRFFSEQAVDPRFREERSRARRLDRISTAAWLTISDSYAERIKAYIKEAARNPDLLNTQKVLPPDWAAMGEAAKLFTRSAMLGLDASVRKAEFAEPTAEDIENMPYAEAVEYLKKRDVLKKVDYEKLSDKLRFRAFTAEQLPRRKNTQRVMTSTGILKILATFRMVSMCRPAAAAM